MTICLNSAQEESRKITNTKELVAYFLNSGNSIEKMSDEERERMESRILAKLRSGKKLTQKELDYLRKTNPIMYAHAMRVQKMAEAIEEQLKHAKSKEEADRIILSSLTGISKNDPDKEYIMAAVNRINTEFHNSGAYSKLPDTMEEANKKNDQHNEDVFSQAEDEEDKDGFDLKNWSPLTEVYDSMPTFSVGA